MASRLTDREGERATRSVGRGRSGPNRRAGSSARSVAKKQLRRPASYPQEFGLKAQPGTTVGIPKEARPSAFIEPKVLTWPTVSYLVQVARFTDGANKFIVSEPRSMRAVLHPSARAFNSPGLPWVRGCVCNPAEFARCGCRTSRARSHYMRQLTDLPWQERITEVQLQAKPPQGEGELVRA